MRSAPRFTKNCLSTLARDTVPIAGVMRLPNLMVVPPSLPVTTVREFIDHARANPNTLLMASSGNGTTTHLSGELFKSMTKIPMTHVPYRGSSAAYPDLMTGKVHVLFDNLTGAIEFVRAGKLRPLGVTTAERWPLVPDIPAIAETVPGYEASVWYGLVAPRGTPAEIVATLNAAVNAGLADPDILARFTEAGGLPMPMTASELGKLIADETERVAKGRRVRRDIDQLGQLREELIFETVRSSLRPRPETGRGSHHPCSVVMHPGSPLGRGPERHNKLPERHLVPWQPLRVGA